MIRRPPRSTRTDTLFPYTTLFRSSIAASFVCSRAMLARRLQNYLPGITHTGPMSDRWPYRTRGAGAPQDGGNPRWIERRVFRPLLSPDVGRASCTDRVGQYGYMSGVDVS